MLHAFLHAGLFRFPLLSAVDTTPFNADESLRFEFVANPLAILFLGVALCGLLFVVFFGTRLSRSVERVFSIYADRRKIAVIAFLIWLCGTVVYAIGFYPDEAHGHFPWTGIALFLHAAMSSVEMFVSHSDLLEVNKNWHHHPGYMFCFMATHVAAVALSVGAVMSIVAYRCQARLTMRLWERRIRRSRRTNGPETATTAEADEATDPTYVFWGVNEPSTHMARQLRGRRIVFVLDQKEEHQGGGHGNRMSLSHLLGMSPTDRDVIEKVRRARGILLRYKGPETLDRIARLANPTPGTACGLRVFFLSNDESANLADLSRAVETGIFGETTEFYCHASRTPENVALAYGYRRRNVRLKIVDSSSLAVLSLKQNGEAHPVNFVTPETDAEGRPTGRVESAFNALIVGFGEVGQEALAFLYEYSAFTGTDNRRSPYRITAVDGNMDRLVGNFYLRRPAVAENPNLRLLHAQIGSETYRRIVTEAVGRGLNYVVVSLGNDSLNRSVAIALYELMMRHAEWDETHSRQTYNGGQFVIYVRNRGRSDQAFGNIYPSSDLRFFGDDHSVFNIATVVDDIHQRCARKFAEKYDNIQKAYPDCDTRIAFPASTPLSPLESERSKARKAAQNLENSYHNHTKIHLLTQGRFTSAAIETFAALVRRPTIAEFEGDFWYEDAEGRRRDYETAVMTNLARCEHHRWVASHEMLGYTADLTDISGKNELTKRHNCLVSWEGLGEIWQQLRGKVRYAEFRQYDYNVVETGLALARETSERNRPESPEAARVPGC